MDAQDILYIVIIAIGIISGILQNRKKKPGTTTSKNEDDIKTVLRDLLNQSKEYQTPHPSPAATVPKQTSSKKRPIQQIEDSVELSPLTTAEIMKAHKKNLSRPVVTEPEEKVMEIDLEKAIVYAEILKRPDY